MNKERMKKFCAIFFAFSVLVLIFSACAKPPKEEMNRAHDAVIRAESDADAVNYGGNALLRARDALARMQSESDAKRYDAAKNLAAEAVSAAEKAIADGKTGAARAKEEAAFLVNSLQGPIADTANALNAARQVKNIDLDLNGLSGDLDLARSTYDSARENLAADKYREAVTQSQNVRSLLAGINAGINDAAQATSRKK